MNLTDYLFHTPWWLPASIAVTGAVLFYVANNRQEVKLRTAGLVVVCVAVLLALVSYFVDTDLEKAVDLSIHHREGAFDSHQSFGFENDIFSGEQFGVARESNGSFRQRDVTESVCPGDRETSTRVSRIARPAASRPQAPRPQAPRRPGFARLPAAQVRLGAAGTGRYNPPLEPGPPRPGPGRP